MDGTKKRVTFDDDAPAQDEPIPAIEPEENGQEEEADAEEEETVTNGGDLTEEFDESTCYRFHNKLTIQGWIQEITVRGGDLLEGPAITIEKQF